MTSVAVVAHRGKKLGGGLEELRGALADRGHPRPIWYEVPKSRKAPKAVRRALEEGATLVFVWGGDGMVQRCIDALAGSEAAVAILPAGTGNLLATSLGIPRDVAKGVEIGLHGTRRHLDVGVMNGERFAAMAGTGFDAIMIGDTDSNAKERLGRLAYLRSSVKALRARRVWMRVRLDGTVWFKGKASCLLIGNIGTVTGGLPVFPDASPCDGLLEVGVVTAHTAWQWLRVFSRVAEGRPDLSPLVDTKQAKKIVVELHHKRAYELDGGARAPVKRLKVHVEAGAVTVCVPAPTEPA
ncbi:MAG TPA: diacylglycerol kinase family protein [Thermoanaerobaculia bacterium]|nr:diacylglycerol kinase family protein [Thermoanaerobaculia bacterium]